jgi:hypothetical protein
VQPAQVEVEVVGRAVVVDGSEVTNLALHPEVIAEVAHHTAADVEPDIVAGIAAFEQAINVAADQPDACGGEWPRTLAGSPADGDADDHVAHRAQDVIAAEDSLIAKESRRVPEVEFTADDAVAHITGVESIRSSSAVVEAVSEVRGDPRADEAIG